MASSALVNHQSAIAMAQALVAIEVTYADPPPPLDRLTVEGLRGGIAVLTVATFENYLREAVQEAMDRINSHVPTCDFSKLPPELQVASTFQGLDQAMRGPKGSPGLTKFDRLADVQSATTRVVNGQVLGDAIAMTRGNPNSGVVTEIFKSVGSRRVFRSIKTAFESEWGSPTSETFIPDKLDEIVSRRHKVAHTASVLTITREDLAEGIRYVSALSKALDAHLVGHTTRLIRAAA